MSHKQVEQELRIFTCRRICIDLWHNLHLQGANVDDSSKSLGVDVSPPHD